MRGDYTDYVEYVNSRPVGLLGPIAGGGFLIDRRPAAARPARRAMADGDPAAFRRELEAREVAAQRRAPFWPPAPSRAICRPCGAIAFPERPTQLLSAPGLDFYHCRNCGAVVNAMGTRLL
jgi:hypothetical protein